MDTPTERVQEVDWKEKLSEDWDAMYPETVEEVAEEVIDEVIEEAVIDDDIEEEIVEDVVEEVEETVVEDDVIESILTEDQKTSLQYMEKDYREAVETLDESLQNEIINHHMKAEKAWRKRSLGFDDDLKLAEDIRQMLSPQALNGTSEQQYLAQLVQQAQALQSNPKAAFDQLAQMFNYDLSTHGQEQGFTDPLQGEVAQIKAALKQQAQNAQHTQLQQAQQQIDDFAKDKPDFKAIEPLITAKVQQGQDLQTAYENVKGELNMSTPVATPASTQRVPIKQKKKAASGVKSTKTVVQQTEPASTRDFLRDNWDKHMGS